MIHILPMGKWNEDNKVIKKGNNSVSPSKIVSIPSYKVNSSQILSTASVIPSVKSGHFCLILHFKRLCDFLATFMLPWEGRRTVSMVCEKFLRLKAT